MRAPGYILGAVESGLSLNYVRDKLAMAVQCLDADEGTLQERLGDAAMSCHILVAPPQLDDAFPTLALKMRYRTWWLAMTSKTAEEDEGTLQATVDAMSDETAKTLEAEIRDIFHRVDDVYAVNVLGAERRH